MTSGPDYSRRGRCVVYALVDDPDYFLFDADPFESGVTPSWEGPVVGHPSEYVRVASVKLRPGTVELNQGIEAYAYGIECDKGRFSAQQIAYGDAGDAVEVSLWMQDNQLTT